MSLHQSLFNALNWRYAVKQFSNQKLTESELQRLLEAVRLSASSYGLQPYRVVVVRSQMIKDQLLQHAYGQTKVAENSHLLVLAADTRNQHLLVERYLKQYCLITGKSPQAMLGFAEQAAAYLSDMSNEQRQEWAAQQAYIALGNLLTCAALLGIDGCPMAGFSREGFDEVLDLKKQNLTATVICPLGFRHPGDASAQAPKVRIDYAELVSEV